jgi:hypothetical protein
MQMFSGDLAGVKRAMPGPESTDVGSLLTMMTLNFHIAAQFRVPDVGAGYLLALQDGVRSVLQSPTQVGTTLLTTTCGLPLLTASV